MSPWTRAGYCPRYAVRRPTVVAALQRMSVAYANPRPPSGTLFAFASGVRSTRRFIRTIVVIDAAMRASLNHNSGVEHEADPDHSVEP
jgi:hypothetical protein